MDGFDGKEFYGYGYSGDPKLQTNTRNYEFKFNNPEKLETMINRVRKDRERQSSESEELEFLSDRLKYRNQFCKKPRPISSELPKNIDTEVGRAKLLETVVKVMSDEDMEEMMSQHQIGPIDRLENSRHVSSNETINLEESGSVERLSKTSFETFPPLEPQWAEIKPVQKSIASISDTRIQTSSCRDDSSDYQEMSELDLRDEGARSDNENERENENENENEPEHEHECHEENHEQPNKNRSNDKAKLLGSLSFDSNLSDDFLIRRTDLENHDDNIDNIDNQKESPPASPISLGSESNLNACETREVQRVFGNGLQIPRMEFQDILSQFESENSDSDQERQIKIPDVNLVRKIVEGNSERYEERSLDSYATKNKSDNTLSFQSARSDETISPKRKKNTKKSSKSPKFIDSGPSVVNSIEGLKQEKLRIFSKMTTIQEKMINLLDQLRMSLIEISLPDGDIEKKTRERNALEFSVRFSRNYLFPLQKMIDDLRITPKEEYRSALTNEPCVKVCGIYGLLLQAVQCYRKQLRHFFSNSFPKKLDQLLNQIMEATNVCLEKQIFDKRDVLIQSLLNRSDMFLGYVMEFARKKSARNEISTGRKNRFKLPKKTSSKFELTMSLNNLNMYEPRLVPKKPKKTVTKKQPEFGSTLKASPSPKVNKKSKNSKDSLCSNFAFLLEDSIDTQVRKDSDIDCLQLIDDAISDQPDSALAKAVIETLQDITKDEVHQMFGPIVTSLDSILKSSDDPQKSVEMFLNVLKSKLNLSSKPQKHQLKIDGIATERGPQKNRTHQAKRGTQSTRSKQQKQELLEKESRLNKLSKPRPRLAKKPELKSYMSVKGDRTERTERYSSRSELTDSNNTKCDKQSPATPFPMKKIQENNGGEEDDSDDACMFDVAAAGSSEAFLSARAAAAAAKKYLAPASYTKLDGGSMAGSITSIALLEAELAKLLTNKSGESISNVALADKIISAGNCGDVEPYQKMMDAFKQRSGSAPSSSHAVRNSLTDSRHSIRSTSLLSPVKDEHSSSNSEIEKLMYRKNALYTFIKYLEKSSPAESENEAIQLSPTESNSIENFYSAKTVVMDIKRDQDELLEPFENKELEVEPPATQSTLNLQKCNAVNKKKKEEKNWNELDILEIIDNRNAFIEKCRDDPLYNNPQFPEPWKVLSKISNVIAHEVVENFECDISFGEESYIRDFINMEIQD